MNSIVDLLYRLSNQVGAYDLNQWELTVERLERENLKSASANSFSTDSTAAYRPKNSNRTAFKNEPQNQNSTKVPTNVSRRTSASSIQDPLPDFSSSSQPSSALPTPVHRNTPPTQNNNSSRPEPRPSRCDANISEFIDVDLIKGSTFSKAKTTLSNWSLLQASLKFYFLLPLYPQFWREQISSQFYQGLLVLYVGQLSCWYFFLHSFSSEEHGYLKASVYELLIPLLFGINLSIIHCRVVSTKFTGNKAGHQGKVPSLMFEEVPDARESSDDELDQPDCPSEKSDVEGSATHSHAEDSQIPVPPRADHKRRSFTRLRTPRTRDNSQCSTTVRKLAEESEAYTGASSAISYSSSDESDSEPATRRVISETNEPNHHVEFIGSSRQAPPEPRCSFSAMSVLDPLHTVHKSTPSYTAKNVKIGCRFWNEIKGDDASLGSSGYASAPSIPKYTCQVVELTAYDIASRMTQTVSDRYSNFFPTSNWALFILAYSTLLSLLPITFRIVGQQSDPLGHTYKTILFTLNGIAFRFLIATVYFSMLCVALRAYYQRLLFAKLFSRITSARRAQKHRLPHFRLSKTKNIKVWLTLRSYLKRRGPQRSIDVIVSSCFLFTITLLCIICVSLLQERENNPNFEGFDYSFKNSLGLWEITAWCAGISIFLLKFIITGSEINKRYLSVSVLLTEQLNLFFRMDQRPEQKEELSRANQVLQVAQRLLNEIESPYKLGGMVMSPLLYQLLRVVVLSAFSGVVSEFLGFKLKLWKIKA